MTDSKIESVDLVAIKKLLLKHLASVAASPTSKDQLEKMELLHKRLNAIERCITEAVIAAK